jgi:hypothetical protein
MSKIFSTKKWTKKLDNFYFPSFLGRKSFPGTGFLGKTPIFRRKWAKIADNMS